MIANMAIPLLLFGPAILALVAIGVGVILMQAPDATKVNTRARMLFGVLCLLLALGIGTCYGWVFLGGGLR